VQVDDPVFRRTRWTYVLPAAPPLPASMLPASEDVAHAEDPAPEDPSPEEPPDDPPDALGDDAEPDDADEGVGADVGVAVTVSVVVADGVVVPPDEQPASRPTATMPTATSSGEPARRCMSQRNHRPGVHDSGGAQPPRGHSRARASARATEVDMAGKHEQARGDEGRSDGVEPRAGSFTDSEIPGEPPVASNEPAGEFVSSDIPGETRPEGGDGEGEYVESDIPGEAEPTPDGEVGHYTDRDQV
jgi:hypothetical protein